MEGFLKSFEGQGLEVNLIQGANYNVFGIVGDTNDCR